MGQNYQLEQSTDRYLLEDSSGVYLLELQDVSLALTGQQCDTGHGRIRADWPIVAHAGQPTLTLSVPLVGQALTGDTGTVVPEGDTGLSVALTGSASTLAAGTLLPLFELAPGGQEATSAAGTVTSESACPPSGQESTSAQGTILPVHSAGIDGLDTTLALGSFIAAQGLTGQALVGSQGTVTPSGGETASDADEFFALRRRRKFGRVNTPLVTQWPPRRIR